MRITVDTNILISATFWYGDSHRIIEWVENKEVELILSMEIIREYAEVLMYKEIQDKIKNKNLEIKHTLQKIAALATIVEPRKKISIVIDDPDDNKILEAAYEGNAQYIISKDKHLLRLKHFENIKIITPQEFLLILH